MAYNYTNRGDWFNCATKLLEVTMRKIFIICLLIMLPTIANAEECQQDSLVYGELQQLREQVQQLQLEVNQLQRR